MGIITEHAFLKKYPVTPSSRVLILGTLHPARADDFELPFFYGNRSSLWKLLSKAYPEQLENPFDLEQVLNFLRRNKIAVSDVVKKGMRHKTRAADADLTALEYNMALLEDIRRSDIDVVVCTGGNHPKGAFGIFTQKIIRTGKIPSHADLITGVKVFFEDRPLRLHAIPSPSGAANRGIASSPRFKKKKLLQGQNYTVESYKIDLIRTVFDPLLNEN